MTFALSYPRFRLTCIAAAVLALSAGTHAIADELDTTALPKVEVKATADHGYDEKTSSTATKTNTLLRDTPQSITVITRKLMNDQAMQSIADAIRYVPGIVTAQGEGNRDAAVFRGNASTGDFYIDGIRDDVQYYRDFYNIERLEALKGPNAMIFGRGAAGGVINRISKQAQWQPVREAYLSVGSHRHRRASADLGGALNERVALRINAMTENSESYRGGVSLERKGINPALSIQAGPSTLVSVDAEHFRDDRVADRGVPSFNGRPYQTDVSTFFGSQELSPAAVRVNAFNGLIHHVFGNGLVLRNRTRIADYDKYYQNVYANSAVSATTGRLALGAYRDETQRTNRLNQTDLSLALHAGAIKHTLAFGVEFGEQDTDNQRRTAAFPGTSGSVPAANPVYTGALAFSTTTVSNRSVARVASVYVQDQVELSPQWQAVLGLRHDRFSVDVTNRLATSGGSFEVKDTPVSPRAGLVYKPIEPVSVYASFSRAYQPRSGDQLTSLNVSNRAFDPEEFDNLELGVKWDVTPSLHATLAVYRLERSNVVVPGAVAGTSILVDGQTSKGVELGLSGSITRAWSVMGGYAYQDAYLTATQSATARDGATLAMVPRHTFSLWNRYDFSRTLGAGLGLVYRDRIYTSTSNAVSLPSYVRVDAALFYQVTPAHRLQVNIENLFDKKYYASAHNDNNITPGSPRALKLSLNAKF